VKYTGTPHSSTLHNIRKKQIKCLSVNIKLTNQTKQIKQIKPINQSINQSINQLIKQIINQLKKIIQSYNLLQLNNLQTFEKNNSKKKKKDIDKKKPLTVNVTR
jgi:Txe/YoeB family toxin of Txe-Axe toxin-antitoxin module